jgi:signal transduction histidine kinase
MLQSDRLAANADPEVALAARRMMEAIDRAVALCSSTLNFVNMNRPLLHLSTFAAADLLDEVATAAGGNGRSSSPSAPAPLETTVAADGVVLNADREQLFRALSNLALNAVQAGCARLTLSARASEGTAVIDVTDNGPGIPDRVRPSLFKPFAGRTGGSGSGLGLVIASEIVTAHRGQLTLHATGSDGTTFRVTLPA